MSDADDKLAICNQVLGEIGTRSTMTSVDPPDGSTEAYYCNLLFNNTRDTLLRAAHWNCAARTEVGVLWKALPGTPENQTVPANFLWAPQYPAPPWLYSYSWPTDLPIQIRRVRGQDLNETSSGVPLFGGSTSMLTYNQLPCARFETANDRFDADGVRLATSVSVILTNARNIIIDFTTSDIEIAEWDPGFQNAFMVALEGKLALSLLGDKAMSKLKLEEANMDILEARVRDGNEALTIYDHIPDWLQVRGVASMGSPWVNPPYYGPLFAV